MKTTTNILILLSISNLAFSQVDGLTHTAGGANWYVGWDNTILSRPKKSLQFLFINPEISLQFIFSPELGLQ